MSKTFFGVLRHAACILILLTSGCSLMGHSPSRDGVFTTLGSCAPYPCVKVSLSALPEIPGSIDGPSRASMTDEVAKVLYAPLEEEHKQPDPDQIVQELSSRLDEFKTVTDADIDWSLTRSAKLLYSGLEVTSIEVLSEGYLGGAHGFKERTLMTFNTKTGARLGVGDVVGESGQRVLLRIVEAEFRRARSIRRDQALQDAGFFILPGQELPLGENFAITDNGMEIQYNPYEIAPFSMGETRVRVPREAMEPIVKAELRGVFTAQDAVRSQ